MNALPWLVGTVGLMALAALVSFIIGFTYGVNFSEAKKARDAQSADPGPLLTPEWWTPDRIARAANAANDLKPLVPEQPRPYKMPGIDDGT
mgnify:CR=1 FL=1